MEWDGEMKHDPGGSAPAVNGVWEAEVCGLQGLVRGNIP